MKVIWKKRFSNNSQVIGKTVETTGSLNVTMLLFLLYKGKIYFFVKRVINRFLEIKRFSFYGVHQDNIFFVS